MNKKNLESVIEEMRSLSLHLIPYSYPQVHFFDDMAIDCLRQRVVIVDGYEVAIHFIRSDFESYHQETLEIISTQSPFLPRYLVCKIGSLFLGSYGLFYTEMFKSGRKAYIWSIKVDSDGRPLAIDDHDFAYSFEGFKWHTITKTNE